MLSISPSRVCSRTHLTWSPRPAGRNGLTKAFPISPATPPAFFILPALPPDPRASPTSVIAGLAANSSVEMHALCWFLGFRFPLCHASPNPWDEAQQKPRRSCSSQIEERPWEDDHVSYHNTQVVRKLTRLLQYRAGNRLKIRVPSIFQSLFGWFRSHVFTGRMISVGTPSAS